MTQIRPKKYFSVEANITKLSLKSWQFFNKFYWNFLTIFLHDFFICPTLFRQKYFFRLLHMVLHDIKKIFLVEQILEKSESKVGSDSYVGKKYSHAMWCQYVKISFVNIRSNYWNLGYMFKEFFHGIKGCAVRPPKKKCVEKVAPILYQSLKKL